MNDLLTRLSPLFHRIGRVAAAIAPLFTRITFGQAFALTGWGKLQNLDNVVAFFTELGIPMPGVQAPMVATFEFVGGILLVLGLATRPAALILTSTMVVALLTAHMKDLGEAFALRASFDGAAPIPYLVATLWLLATGAGAVSVDAVWTRRARQRGAA